MTSLKIATWNLKQRTGDAAARLGSLLSDLGGADLVLLQESSEGGLPRFVEAAGLDWGVHLQSEFYDLLRVRGRAGRMPVDGGDRFSNGRDVAIAGRGAPLRGACPFPDVPLPEKVMAGWVDIGGRRTTLVSYHAPAGVTHGVDKPKQAVRIAEWLASLDGPAVLGGDFNTPGVDTATEVRTHFHTGHPELKGGPGDDVLVGLEPVHTLSDALRTYLADHPEVMEVVVAERPEGPLAVSYRSGKKPEHAKRYDAIWLSPHFSVNSVEYHYEAAKEAGTDHALVIADVTLNDPDPVFVAEVVL